MSGGQIPLAALSNVCVLVGAFDLFRQIVGNQCLYPILTAILNRLLAVSAFEPQHIQRTVHVRAAESRAPKSAWTASALLPSCNGAESPEMFTLNRCKSGSFAVMLQNGSVMMPGVISPTPSSSNSTRLLPRSRTKHSYRSMLSRYAAPCRNVSSRTHGTSCQPQCGHRGTSSLRISNPALLTWL